MAIDTALLRRAVSGVSRFWRAPGQTPNASKPALWRALAGRGWAQDATSPPATPALRTTTAPARASRVAVPVRF